MRKLMVTSGSPNTEVTVRVFIRQSVSVINVSINLNAPNGVSILKDTVSGAG